ncbi:MAG: CD225/dispanin family protein [Actinomycetia bacterium]|nr:CD225/dispanin family protein [Actinomycetes bacterium]
MSSSTPSGDGPGDVSAAPPPPPGSYSQSGQHGQYGQSGQHGQYGQAPPPPPGSYGQDGTPPPNYLVIAILAVLCLLPLGIVSILFSTQVNSKWYAGDRQGAQVASERARLWAILGLVIGTILTIIGTVGLAAGWIALEV